MNQKKEKKVLVAWIFLFILIILILTLSYVKFFSLDNSNIEERPINNSSSSAVHSALKDITTNFNKNPKIREYLNQGTKLKASVNNFSLFISYITDTTTTFEFTYDNLNLSIIVNTDEEEFLKFKVVYQLLIEAVQERLNNEDSLDIVINNFFTTDAIYEGLSKKEVDGGIEYKIDITKRLKIS